MNLIELPLELQSWVAVGFVFIVTEGLKVVSGWFGKDLSRSATVIAAGLVAAFVAFANVLLTMVPLNLEPLVNGLFQFIVVLLSAFGVHRQFKRFR